MTSNWGQMDSKSSKIIDEKILEEIIKSVEKLKAPKEEKKTLKDKVKDIEVPKQEKEKINVADFEQTTSYAKKVIADYLNESSIMKTAYDAYMHSEETKADGVFNNHIVDLVTLQEAQKVVRFTKVNHFFGASDESSGYNYISEAQRERYKWWSKFNRVQSFMVYELTTI